MGGSPYILASLGGHLTPPWSPGPCILAALWLLQLEPQQELEPWILRLLLQCKAFEAAFVRVSPLSRGLWSLQAFSSVLFPLKEPGKGHHNQKWLC